MQLEQNRRAHRRPRAWDASCRSSALDAEQKRFEVGMSTNFNVIQAQRDLAVARNSELLAQLDYQLALIAFETVQRVGAAGAISTFGGAITPTPSSCPRLLPPFRAPP